VIDFDSNLINFDSELFGFTSPEQNRLTKQQGVSAGNLQKRLQDWHFSAAGCYSSGRII